MNWDTNDRPNHRCKVCGALWWLGNIAGVGECWSLRSEKCGPCCDNVAMGEQIEPLSEALEASEAEVKRLTEEQARFMSELRDGYKHHRHVFIDLAPDSDENDYSECLRCGNSEPNAAQGCLEYDRKRRFELSKSLATARSQLAAMTEALMGFRFADGFPGERGGFFHDCVAGDCSKCEAAKKALSPTSAKEWEEKVRADERERCIRAIDEAFERDLDAAPQDVVRALGTSQAPDPAK